MKINALVAEFLGTMILCLAGIGAIVNSAGLLGVALAHGIAIVVAGTALGAISGGHFNPAVSLAMLIGKKISLPAMIGYWIAQIAGAIAGASLIKVTFPESVLAEHTLGVPALLREVSATNGMILEAIGTFILVLTIFGTAVDGRAPKMGAMFIGLSISAMILAIGPITGCGINPARWIGPAVVISDLSNPLVYVAGPLVGAALAAIVYQSLFAEKAAEAAKE
jgi:MIP family channel proteins